MMADDEAISSLEYDCSSSCSSSSNNNNKNKNKDANASTISTIYTVDEVKIKRQHSFWLNEQLYQSFKKTARLIGRPSTSQALQEAMAEYMENHSHQLPTGATINIIQPRQVNINLTKRLELKLIRKDLSLLIQTIENKRGNKNFFLEKLKELLPKALRIYEKTSDPEMENLLKQTEKWV